MEYKILGLSENATVKEAERALQKIRKQCRPDALTSLPDIERLKNKHFLELAEESFQRIRQKQKVNEALSSLTPFTRNPFDIFDKVEKHMSEIKKKQPGSVQTSSYSYQNINGNVSESGTINGRPMTDIELKRQRQPMNSLVSYSPQRIATRIRR